MIEFKMVAILLLRQYFIKYNASCVFCTQNQQNVNKYKINTSKNCDPNKNSQQQHNKSNKNFLKRLIVGWRSRNHEKRNNKKQKKNKRKDRHP